MTTEDFKDIVLINDNDSQIQKEMDKKMNESKIIVLKEKYDEPFQCICGKSVMFIKSHLQSGKHKRFVNKHGINIELEKKPDKIYRFPKIEPKRPRGRPRIHPKVEKKPRIKKPKVVKPKKPRGRPAREKPLTQEEKRTAWRKYSMNYLDNNEEQRKKHNERVRKYRDENLEICRNRVRETRRKQREERLKANNV